MHRPGGRDLAVVDGEPGADHGHRRRHVMHDDERCTAPGNRFVNDVIHECDALRVEIVVGLVKQQKPRLLDEQPQIVGVTGIVNDRVVKEVQALELVTGEEAPRTVAELQAALEGRPTDAVAAEDLYVLAGELGYDAELKWGTGSRDQLDMVLQRRGAALDVQIDATKCLRNRDVLNPAVNDCGATGARNE